MAWGARRSQRQIGMTVRVIDCETTGTDAAVDAVIEIASVDVLADGTITNRQEVLVCPPIPVPPEASAVHHLLYQDLTGKPPLKDVLPMFAGAQAYVAHKAEFEQAFLGEHLGDALWVCTWKCALRVWPDFPSHSNQALQLPPGAGQPVRDRSPDAEPAPGALRRHRDGRRLRRAHEAREVVRPRALVGGAGALHAAAHRAGTAGERFDAVPEDYLRWIVEGRNELREEVKASARYWMKRRSPP